MWNFENCNPSNKIFSGNIKLDEIHKFNNRYYYTIDIVYNEEKKKFVSTVSLFEKTGNKIFDMEVEMNKSFSSSSVEDDKKEIIEYLGYLANSDDIGGSSFFLAKKMFIQHGSYRKYGKSLIFMQDVTFFIPEKQNKNNFTQIFKEGYYLVSIYSDRFRLGNNIPKIHIPYFERNGEIEFFFYSQEIREVETLKKEIIGEDTFYSNKNKLLDKYYTITNDRLKISNIIYYKPLKMLFSFFEKQLDKKGIKNYEIFLGNYENNFNSNNYSSLYSVAIQLQIFVNGVFDEKLTEELMEIYSQTGGNISRNFLGNINGEDVYGKYINFLVDKFSPIFTFDKEFSETILRSFVDLGHGYFYLDSFSRNDGQLGKNNIYKYSYEENKFIPLEKPSQTDQIFDKFSSKKGFCYINSNFKLKILIEGDKEYTINLVKAFEINDTSKLNSESFKDLMMLDNGKEIFVSYEKKIIYLPFKKGIGFDKIHKFEYQYIFEQKTIFGHSGYWLRQTYGYFNATVGEVKINIPVCNLINFDPKTILFKKIIINDLYLKNPSDDSTTSILDGYRIMYGLKGYFFIKKQIFELKKEIRDEDVRKENIFSKGVCKYIGSTTRIINNSYRSVSTSQNSAIEKLSKGVLGKKVFGISNGKIGFYE